MLVLWGCKKMCKIFASELGFKLGIMRGLQEDITLLGRTPESVHNAGLQKKFAKISLLSWDPSQGL